jgi:uncharacterized protein YkwD
LAKPKLIQIVSLFLAAAVVSGTLLISPGRVYGESVYSSNQAVENTILEVVNQNRSHVHRGMLIQSDSLTEVARIRSQDMAKKGYFSHRTPEGATVFDIMQGMNIIYMKASENLWLGTIEIANAQTIVDSWMRSRSHKKIILKKCYAQAGVGVVDCDGNRIVTIVLTN